MNYPDGAAAADLRWMAQTLRDEAATSMFEHGFAATLERILKWNLADRYDAEADRLGPSWCILCGSTDGVPQAHATEPVPCTMCGAATTPRMELKGILDILGD